MARHKGSSASIRMDDFDPMLSISQSQSQMSKVSYSPGLLTKGQRSLPELKDSKASWKRNAGGKWPGIRSTEVFPTPPSRMRSLICNCPSHFCKESLIVVPSGGEPIAPPHRLAATVDLRARKEEIQNKHTYLVALDLERLRKIGGSSGMGVDAFQAADSWISRDCVCSEIVPLRRLYGETHINLYPPETNEGEVLMLLRVITVGDITDKKDWRPIGDCVLVRVEPRVTNLDKDYIRNLESELTAVHGAKEELQTALDDSQAKHLGAVEEIKELKANKTALEYQKTEHQGTIAELQSNIEQLSKELDEKQKTEMGMRTALMLRTAVDQSKKRQLQTAAEAEKKLTEALETSEKERETVHEEVRQVKEQLDMTAQELLEANRARKAAKTAGVMQSAVTERHRRSIISFQAKTEQDEDELNRLRQELDALKEAKSSVEKELQRTKQDVESVKKDLEEEKANRIQEQENAAAALESARAAAAAADEKAAVATAAAEKAVAEKAAAEKAAAEKAAASSSVVPKAVKLQGTIRLRSVRTGHYASGEGSTGDPICQHGPATDGSVTAWQIESGDSTISTVRLKSSKSGFYLHLKPDAVGDPVVHADSKQAGTEWFVEGKGDSETTVLLKSASSQGRYLHVKDSDVETGDPVYTDTSTADGSLWEVEQVDAVAGDTAPATSTKPAKLPGLTDDVTASPTGGDRASPTSPYGESGFDPASPSAASGAAPTSPAAASEAGGKSGAPTSPAGAPSPKSKPTSPAGKS